MRKKSVRPTIPENVRYELWARAAGRCEFRGCNKFLCKDDLTQQRSNLGTISHIVAYSPTGPRGNPIRSKQLEKDINNLMLTCRDHGKVIDDKARETEYTEETLREFKREHEQRIRMLTEAKEDAQTHVLLLQVPIDAQGFTINQTAAFRAVLPKYPAEETPMVIDLSGLTVASTSDGFFQIAAQSITEQTHAIFHSNSRRKNIKNLSVFALAPIPLLVHFGNLLGDIDHVDLYQHHRYSQDWTWKQEKGEEEIKDVFRVFYPAKAVSGNRECKIALILSVSMLVKHSEIEATLGEDLLIYEIRAKEPGLDFLQSRGQLAMFGYEARKMLEMLREFDRDCVVHLFAAVPAPVAIEFGRNIKKFHPPILVYEYEKSPRTHLPALRIND